MVVPQNPSLLTTMVGLICVTRFPHRRPLIEQVFAADEPGVADVM